MSTLQTYGEINGHLIGILMKELARRVISRVQALQFKFDEFQKEAYDPDGKPDIFTTADLEAQDIYLKSLRECTPTFGVVGEEGNLRVACTHPTHDIWWTLDPVDGTKAFKRRQSHGIGTMISLVCDRKVIAALVGDIMTEELFYYRPGSSTVHRISKYSKAERLEINTTRKLVDQYLLLRDPLDRYTYDLRNPVESRHKSPLFKSYLVDGGSIGTSFARLWKGEIGALALLPGYQTPWDFCPILGMSQQLGFVFIRTRPQMEDWLYTPSPPRETFHNSHELLVMHSSRLEEYKQWFKQPRQQ